MDRQGKRIYFSARSGKGWGTGHLLRSCRLIARLRVLGCDARLLLKEEDDQERCWEFCRRCDLSGDVLVDYSTALQKKQPALIVCDQRESSLFELSQLSELGTLVGIDEGGPLRDAFPYLIDLLGGGQGLSKPNVCFAPLLAPLDPYRKVLKQRREERREGPMQLLISFGGEDPAGLSEQITAFLEREGLLSGCRTILVRGAACRRRGKLPAAVEEMEPVDSLLPLMQESDLIITSFGLTAWEAAAVDLPVLLYNPAPYHQELAHRAGFASLGYPRQRRAAALRRKFFRCFPGGLLSRERAGLLPKPGAAVIPSSDKDDLASFLADTAAAVHRACTVCGESLLSEDTAGIYRSRERSFRRCPVCGSAVLYDRVPPRARYGKEYFFSEYRAQYGKDYLEDFDHIKGLCRPRLEQISRLLPASGEKRVLDIGCAYGPFLEAAREFGFRGVGIELSAEAAAYTTERTSCPVYTGAAHELLAEDGAIDSDAPFDAVSMWFVIEHLPDIRLLLEKIRRILKPGGVLAFSSPSLSGISGRSRPGDFLSESPADHLFIMDPKRLAPFLLNAGFQVKQRCSCGIHPERFPAICRVLPGPLFSLMARGFYLGDTFEIYAVRL